MCPRVFFWYLFLAAWGLYVALLVVVAVVQVRLVAAAAVALVVAAVVRVRLAVAAAVALVLHLGQLPVGPAFPSPVALLGPAGHP